MPTVFELIRVAFALRFLCMCIAFRWSSKALFLTYHCKIAHATHWNGIVSPTGREKKSNSYFRNGLPSLTEWHSVTKRSKRYLFLCEKIAGIAAMAAVFRQVSLRTAWRWSWEVLLNVGLLLLHWSDACLDKTWSNWVNVNRQIELLPFPKEA